MMKKTKIIIATSLCICLLLVLAAYLYTYIFSDYNYDTGMEFHIYPEEFDEEYTDHTEIFTLEKNTDYQIKVEATCQTGTMELTIHYADGNSKQYSIDKDTPFDELIEVAKNTASEIKITVHFNSDTKGTLIGDVYKHKHYFFI